MSGAIRPENDHDSGFLVGQSGLASFSSPWKDTSKSHCVSFTITWSAFAATAGTLSFEGTDDPLQAAPVTLTVPTSHGTYPTVGTSAAGCVVVFENCPRYVRCSYTRSAGGTTGQFNVFVGARAT